MKVLKDQQESEIARLEKAVSDMRIKHNEAVQKLKAGFLEEKKKFEEESEDKLKELSKKARKVKILFAGGFPYCLSHFLVLCI